jgi:hypothetical protein
MRWNVGKLIVHDCESAKTAGGRLTIEEFPFLPCRYVRMEQISSHSLFSLRAISWIAANRLAWELARIDT